MNMEVVLSSRSKMDRLVALIFADIIVSYFFPSRFDMFSTVGFVHTVSVTLCSSDITVLVDQGYPPKNNNNNNNNNNKTTKNNNTQTNKQTTTTTKQQKQTINKQVT